MEKINKLINKIEQIVNDKSSQEAPEAIMLALGTEEKSVAIEVLARAFVIIYTRMRFAEAKNE